MFANDFPNITREHSLCTKCVVKRVVSSLLHISLNLSFGEQNQYIVVFPLFSG